ncbi:MAG: hypothetical protein KC419_26890, partial [Anaerolineales bacterium]|nr:hypothetical protein [Anaerolineales bacterium]
MQGAAGVAACAYLFMDSTSGKHSLALLAAQKRLLALREQLSEKSNQLSVIGNHSLPHCPPITALPPHLGWGSAALTAVLRQSSRQAVGECEISAVEATSQSSVLSPQSLVLSPDDTIKLFPDIALGLLRQEQTAPGRIWLLLRFLDRVGQGWIRIATAKETLTDKKSPIHTCGLRQLRNLLRDGNGLFWTRDKTRIWLKSAANVAAALGVTKLKGKPVAVPIHVLTGNIGEVRAHLYAAFHSGRAKADRRQPIARETLAALTGVGRRTQLAYETVTGLTVQHNYAIGERYSPETAE